ncbi:MAG: TolC family protein [Bacteroidaceae bacterium]|nr:TolC family protein [Bacteroidaceae bacterium]
MKRTVIIPLLIGALPACGQEAWTVERCMQYAVEHNHEVRLQALALDDRNALRRQAVGAFLPQVEASTSGQYNFGRAIDPETNTYTDVSTFYNGYGLSASLPLFDGMRRLHELRMARADVLMGRNALQAERDRVALAVMQSYADVLYYQGTVAMTECKQSQSRLMLQQTESMYEVGTKGMPDVAQMRAQLAADDLELTRHRNLLAQAMLRLRQEMALDTASVSLCLVPLGRSLPPVAPDKAATADDRLPELMQARFAVESARHAYRAARSQLFPTLSVGAGISTTYYKTLHADGASAFSDQLRHNAGHYVYATLSVPLFGRLQSLTRLRRQRNALLMAQERMAQKSQEMRRLLAEADMECEGARREALQTQARVEADSLALSLATRQYELGLASPLDVSASAAQLWQSRAQLLRSHLTCLLKNRLSRYYRGESLWTE